MLAVTLASTTLSKVIAAQQKQALNFSCQRALKRHAAAWQRIAPLF